MKPHRWFGAFGERMSQRGEKFWSGDVGYSGLIGITLDDVRHAFNVAEVEAHPDRADVKFINGSLNNFRLAKLRERGFSPTGAIKNLLSVRKAIDRALANLLPSGVRPDPERPYMPPQTAVEDVSAFFAETLDPEEFNLLRLRRFADPDGDYSFYEDTKAAIQHLVFLREAVRSILGDIDLDKVEYALLDPDRRLMLQLSVVFQVNAGQNATVNRDRISSERSSPAGDFVRAILRATIARMPPRRHDGSRLCSLVGDLTTRKRIRYHLEELRRSDAYRINDPDIQAKISELRSKLEAALVHRKNEEKNQNPSV